METGFVTKGRTDAADSQVVRKARLGLALDKLAWSVLEPKIEAAEAAQDLPALRSIESDIRRLISDLVQNGIYRVQELLLGAARATGQELTREEEERESNKQDIDFARALDDEDMMNTYERVRSFVLNWMDVNRVPAEIRGLFDELPPLYHGSIILWTGQELTDSDAYCLADSYRKTMLHMASMRRARAHLKSAPTPPQTLAGEQQRRKTADAESLMADLEVLRQEWTQAAGGDLRATTVDLALLFEDIEEMVEKRTS